MVRSRSLVVLSAVILTGSVCGCSLQKLDDPNVNPKVRYQMAHLHADRVLEQEGSAIRSYSPDYDLTIFTRRYVDEETGGRHRFELYEFRKISVEPGPTLFVIAYDDLTRETYLRDNLHSNVNLERLRHASDRLRADE